MLQDEKRKANQAVLEAEDAERKRIAADLHDSLGTYAASIASNIDHVNLLPADENSAVALQELRVDSQSIVSELADTIWVLKKNALPVTAISDRLKNLLQRLQRSYPDIQIEVEEDIITDIILSPSQAFHLFHIVSEAVNNAVKHSSGNQVFVKIFSDNNWRFCIEDNGCGYPDNTKKDAGNGIANMKARSKEMCWNISWQTITPRGTKVCISNTPN